MVRKLLMAGAALVCAMTGGQAQAGLLSPPSTPTSGDMVEPFEGSINPFEGSINPFYGSINPFYGQISPFWGNIQPYWGDINPFIPGSDPFYANSDAFWGSASPFNGSNGAFWQSLGPYWQSVGPQWGAINTLWTNLQAANATDYSSLQSQLQAFLAQSAAFWGTQVQKYTGEDFYDGFADAMLAKYGIDVNDPSTLENMDAATRSMFFLNWYDGLMSFTGVNHVDWWMPAIDWSPMLAQTADGAGAKITVGLLDSTINAGGTNVANINFIGGYDLYVNNHGAAVASLIAGAEDGQGVMGVAPNAAINLYNPFDATGTASWQDVEAGIAALYASGAHVVNASLGVPGTTVSDEWVNILSGSLLSGREESLVIVKAAGNEGVFQTANVPWLLGLEPPNNLIIVGSVGPTGQISSFSNMPGTACFTILGICSQQNELMYHYIVAPGELMLVSDNNGGVTRMSGTSFAAPLVTGTIALMYERWPWLQNYANETAQIIFQSATHLGSPGVNSTYGWGELNVEGALSPLNFSDLTVYQPYTYTGQSVSTPLFANSSSTLLKNAVLAPGQLNLWQTKGAYVVAFEAIGGTYRDFEIPLSSMLVGKSQTVNGNSNPFQSYLYARLIDWAKSSSTLDFDSTTQHFGAGDWQLDMVTTQSSPDEERRGEGPVHAELVARDQSDGFEMRLGEGSGAHAFLGDGAFAMHSDFDPSTGGVDPVLGFASGGMYARGAVIVARGLEVNLGYSQNTDSHSYLDPTFGAEQTVPLPVDRAAASVAGIDYKALDNVTLHISYTNLNEADALLGSQGTGPFALTNGARTQGTTFGSTIAFDGGWTLSNSATLARTTAANEPVASGLTLAQNGLVSTAFEVAGGKRGLFEDADVLRVSLTQPLHVEDGALNYTSLQVVDRNTGAVGPVTQSWGVSGDREYRAEALYGVPVLYDRAQFEGFGLVDINPPQTPQTHLALSAGVDLRVPL